MRLKIAVFTFFGFVFLGIGAVGVFLPLLPTTPFVLVSATCFSQTPKIKARIMKISFFKEHIENYQLRKGLSKKTVIISLSYLWIMLFISIFVMKILWVSIMLSCIGMAVTTHILWIAKAKDK